MASEYEPQSALKLRMTTRLSNGHDGIRIASSDTIERTLRKLSCDNITYENTDKVSYAFNTADRLNSLLLKLLKITGQLNPGDCIDLDFDHQFI